jgi:hypothetical protein
MPRTKTKHYTSVGDSSRLEQGRAEWSFNEKLSVTVPYEGVFEKCLSARPARGAELPGFATDGLLVVSSRVEQLEGGMGRLTVTLEAELPEDEEVSTEPIGEPVFTIEWIEMDVKIESLKKCGSISAAGAAAGITDLADEWEKVAANPDYYQSSGDKWNSSEYISLKKKGVESKRCYYPKVTRTTYHFAKPSDLGDHSGKPQVPPIPSGFGRLADFQWLAGADSATRQNKLYERRSEWFGVDEIEPLLYPED